MGIFSNREEAEKKYEELQAKLTEKDDTIAALKVEIEKLKASAGVAGDEVAAVKASFEERIEIAIAAGIANEEIRAIVSAEDVKTAAMESIKAIRSKESTVAPTSDIDDGDFEGKEDSERLKAIEDIVKKNIKG